MEETGRTGFTLIELLVTVAVLALLGGIAVPAMSHFVDNGRLRGAAEQLLQDLRQARSRALTVQEDVYVAFAAPAAKTWCYGWHERDACDCRVPDGCAASPGGTARARSGNDFPGITLNTPRYSPAYTLHFAALRGTADAATFRLSGRTGEIRVIVSPLGRVRTCAPSVPGFSPC